MFIKENRLVFKEAPPEKPKEQASSPKKKAEEKPEKPKTDKEPQRDHAKEIGEELMGPPVEAASSDSLKTRTPKYDRKLEETPPAKREELRKRITTDDTIGESDLQGGYEWLGLKEKDQDRKHALLSTAYLDKTGDILTVRNELNDNRKTKYGIGAGDLLPPSIITITVTDKRGRKRSGTRAIVDGRIGYYTKSGKYIPIFSGYKITPNKYIQENSAEYKATAKNELKIYKNREDAITDEEAAAGSTPSDVVNYVDSETGTVIGRIDTPVSRLSSLRTKSRKNLDAYFGQKGFNPDQGAESIRQIETAQTDLKKIDGVIAHFGIGLHADSEIRGGSYLVALGGKGAKMLGWNSKCQGSQEELFKKLTDKKFLEEVVGKGSMPIKYKHGEVSNIEVEKDGDKFVIKENGKTITNLETWSYQQAAKLAEKTKTTSLVLSMQTGNYFMGEKFSDKGYWRLNLSDLGKLNELANSPEAFKAKIATIKERPIPPHKLLEVTPIVGGKTMSRAEAIEYSRANGFSKLYSNPRYRSHFDRMYRAKKRGGSPKIVPGTVSYNWNIHSGRRHHPNRGGIKCCADMVSDILGLKGREGSMGRSNNVSVLGSRLMEANQKVLGNDGIVFGFENYQAGDAVIWSHGAKTSLTHIGIVRSRITIDGVDYVAIQHDSSTIQVDLIPVRKGTSVKGLTSQLRSRSLLARQKPEDRRKLEEILAYRKSHPRTVRVRRNSGSYGDRNQGRGSILYAIRTTSLQAQSVA
jgi:hypothetical protein